MQPINRILFAVKDPHARRQPGIEKAIRVAHTLDASIELFHALSNPVLLELKRETLTLARQRLEKFVEYARKLGVPATSAVEWDFPPHEAILRAARKFRADLIVAECHKGRRLAPWLIHLTDWELLRFSHLPVLLFRNTKPWSRAPVLAAVDPSHLHSKPSRLDDEIVAQASRLAEVTHAALHLVHANYPPFVGVAAAESGMDAALLSASYEHLKARDRDDFSGFARRAAITSARRHLVEGDPVHAIPKAARAVGAGVVVMGAVSRSGLKRVFIGNTAERVLNALPCDVLVVKAPGFRKRLPDRPRGVRVELPQALIPMPV